MLPLVGLCCQVLNFKPHKKKLQSKRYPVRLKKVSKTIVLSFW